ncbi:DUF2141 domain-containing protein [Sphingomonas koreensis]
MAIEYLLLSAALTSSVPQQSASHLASCAQPGPHPAIEIEVVGFKDRRGLLRVELYPDNDADFLADDITLIKAGKFFGRAEIQLPSDGPVVVCLVLPKPMRVAVLVHHDRDGSRRFSVVPDGIGFGGNPRLGWRKPKAANVAIAVPSGGTRIRIMLNYQCGLAMRPLADC